MTKIEERAKQYAADEFLVSMSHSKTIEDIAIRAYSKGAIEQHKIDIEKACDAFAEIIDSVLYSQNLKQSAIESFRRIMEE